MTPLDRLRQMADPNLQLAAAEPLVQPPVGPQPAANDDDLGPTIVNDKRAEIGAKALEKLRKLATPPKPPAAAKPALREQAAGEVQRDTDAVAAEQKRRQDDAKAAETGGVSFGSVVRDVSQGVMETFTANPARNALLQGAWKAADEVGDSITDLILYPFGYSHEDLRGLPGSEVFALGSQGDLPGKVDLAGPQSTTGQLVSGITQFGVAMVGVGKFIKGAGFAAQVAKGAVAETAAFDEADSRLSDLVQSFPALRNPVTEYLAGDDDDSFLEGKFKQALEGALGGGLTETLFRGVKAYRAAAHARAATPQGQAKEAIKAAEGAVSETGEEGLELSSRDWMMLGGDPEKPLVSVSQPTPKVEVTPDRAARADALADEIGAEAFDEPGKIRLGNGRVANINLNRIDGPDQLREIAEKIGKTMVDAGEIGPTVRQPTDEARRLSDILLTDPDTMRTWLSGQSATGRAFSREEIIGAGEVMTQNLANTRALAQKIAKGGGTDADKMAFHRSFALQQSMMALVSQQSREAGRALQAFRTTVGSSKRAAGAIREVLANEGNTERMAQVLLALEHPGQQSKFMEDVVNGGGVFSKAGSVLTELYYNGILSGPRTHMVNIIGNSLATASYVGENYAAAAIGKNLPVGEANAVLWGTIQGIKPAFKMAAQVWKSGVPSTQTEANLSLKRRAITAEKFGVKRTPSGNSIADFEAAGIDALGALIRAPGRALMTSDEFFKTIARGQMTAKLAYQRAASEGLTGNALSARVYELRTHPPAEFKDQVNDFAAYQTFSNELGKTGKYLQQVTNNPLGMILMPFKQTPINIMKMAVAKGPFGLATKAVRDELRAGGARRDLAMAQVGLGSIVMATAADYAAQGLVTGAAPTDPGMKAAWEREGILPYAFKVPGIGYVQYTRIDPGGFAVGLASDFSNIMKSWGDAEGLELSGADLAQVRESLREKYNLSQEQIEEQIERLDYEQQQGGKMTPTKVGGAMIVALKNNILNRTSLSGLSEFFGIFDGASPELMAQNAERYLQRTALSFVPFSAAIRTGEQVMDPNLRDAATMTEAFRSMVPGWSSGLPAIPNLWGEPRQTTVGLSPIATSVPRQSPADQEFIRLGYAPRDPPKDFKGVRLNPQEYSDFVKLAGDGLVDPSTGLTARGTIDAMATGTHPDPGVNFNYANASDGASGGKVEMIKKVLDTYRDEARKEMLRGPTHAGLKASIAIKKELADKALEPR